MNRGSRVILAVVTAATVGSTACARHPETLPSDEHKVADSLGFPLVSKPLRRLISSRSVSDGLRVVSFSPDGRQLAVGGNHTTIDLIDSGNGTVVQQLTGHHAPVRALRFSPDGRRLASGDASGRIFMWDVAAAAHDRSFTASRVEALAFSPDGRQLASGGEHLLVWTIATGTLAQDRELGDAATARPDAAYALDYAPDGKTIVTGSDTSVRLWDVTTGREQRRLQVPAAGSRLIDVRSVQFSRTGDRLIAASAAPQPAVFVWDSQTGALQESLLDLTSAYPDEPDGFGDWNRVTSAVSTADGAYIFIAAGESVRVWNTQSATEVYRLALPRSADNHLDLVTGLALSPDASRLATVGMEGSVLLWSTCAIWHQPLPGRCP